MRASVVSLMYTICIEGLPRQFDALLARLHQQSMLIFVTIALGHPKSALEPFQDCRGPRSAFFQINLLESWTVLKPYILPQRHKRLISNPKNRIIAESPTQKSSIIAALQLYSAFGFNIATILRI